MADHREGHGKGVEGTAGAGPTAYRKIVAQNRRRRVRMAAL